MGLDIYFCTVVDPPSTEDEDRYLKIPITGPEYEENYRHNKSHQVLKEKLGHLAREESAEYYDWEKSFKLKGLKDEDYKWRSTTYSENGMVWKFSKNDDDSEQIELADKELVTYKTPVSYLYFLEEHYQRKWMTNDFYTKYLNPDKDFADTNGDIKYFCTDKEEFEKNYLSYAEDSAPCLTWLPDWTEHTVIYNSF